MLAQSKSADVAIHCCSGVSERQTYHVLNSYEIEAICKCSYVVVRTTDMLPAMSERIKSHNHAFQTTWAYFVLFVEDVNHCSASPAPQGAEPHDNFFHCF